MQKLVLTLLAFTAITTSTYAQTLFQFGNNPVSKEEFLRVYQKNSMNKKPDMSEGALRDYLDLYSLFRMKVKEAEAQHIDTIPQIQYELNSYRKQLAKNYLTDDNVNERLIKEAYERMKEEVRVAHILVYSSAMGASADTVKQYQKIDSIYNAIVKGKADFAAMAERFSEDQESKKRGGDIGYFTAMQTIYAFENAAYNTPVGKVSKPFRTQFGYHIVKVLDRRPAKGQIQVQNILIQAQKSKGEAGMELAKKRMDSVLADLKKGMTFDAAVKKYSDDKYTIADNGLMKPFGPGEYSAEFDAAAFALKNPGDVSEPIQTDYGLHLLKLVQKIPVKPYDTLRPMLKRKVENDSRAQTAKEAFLSKIKQQGGFKEYPANFEALVNTMLKKIPDTGKLANVFNSKDYANMTQPVFDFHNKAYTQYDLVSYTENLTRGKLLGARSAVMRDVYNLYVTNILNDYEEHKLEDENTDFKLLMREYKDGIMLFELMDRNVWTKASKDTAGLKKFFETKNGKYMWEPGFKGAIYTFKDEATAKEAQKVLSKKGVKDEDVVKALNTENKPDAVNIMRGHYEFSKIKDVAPTMIQKGKMTEPMKNESGTYKIIVADEVYNTPTPKTLDEAKGYVVAEYQDYLEKNWNAEMRKKYPVKVNEDVFKSMVK
ncbi:MAG: peptidylprolyl isomerase [Bacteroidetes bacterium]|nr:peptidylprolyl isomerase [Bacteroidota bacterium]